MSLPRFNLVWVCPMRHSQQAVTKVWTLMNYNVHPSITGLLCVLDSKFAVYDFISSSRRQVGSQNNCLHLIMEV